MAGSLLVQPYPAELAAQPCTVAVTGCTGYVAGCIVQRLLALGHTVHGTCRDLSKAKDLQVRRFEWFESTESCMHAKWCRHHSQEALQAD